MFPSKIRVNAIVTVELKNLLVTLFSLNPLKLNLTVKYKKMNKRGQFSMFCRLR